MTPAQIADLKARILKAGEQADMEGVEIPVAVPTYHIRRIALAAARAALAHVKDEMRSKMSPYTAYAQAERILGQALAALTEQEQTDTPSHAKDRQCDSAPALSGPEWRCSVCGQSKEWHIGEQEEKADQSSTPAPSEGRTAEPEGGASAQPATSKWAEDSREGLDEALLQEAYQFDFEHGPPIEGPSWLVAKLASALRASETARQQAIERLKAEWTADVEEWREHVAQAEASLTLGRDDANRGGGVP